MKTIERAIEKKHVSMYKTDTKNEAKRLKS